jgi:NhaP-type Na+/H+ or K+/H+ antiporter
LYTGLAQGAIVGLAVGATVAWVLSRSLRFVEVEGDEDEQESEEA